MSSCAETAVEKLRKKDAQNKAVRPNLALALIKYDPENTNI
jgi:hypothetical protein